jgi:hypothetical protein
LRQVRPRRELEGLDAANACLLGEMNAWRLAAARAWIPEDDWVHRTGCWRKRHPNTKRVTPRCEREPDREHDAKRERRVCDDQQDHGDHGQQGADSEA